MVVDTYQYSSNSNNLEQSKPIFTMVHEYTVVFVKGHFDVIYVAT